ncbi:MAG: hypothetical protein VW362_07915, partial [Candidatus Nanopelagicales bacterium]
MTPEDSVLAVAGSVLDGGDVLTDTDIIESYRFDRSSGTSAGQPFAVVFPRTTEQVSALMAAAYE